MALPAPTEAEQARAAVERASGECLEILSTLDRAWSELGGYAAAEEVSVADLAAVENWRRLESRELLRLAAAAHVRREAIADLDEAERAALIAANPRIQ